MNATLTAQQKQTVANLQQNYSAEHSTILKNPVGIIKINFGNRVNHWIDSTGQIIDDQILFNI